MARPTAHLLQKDGAAHFYWGQVIGTEGQTLRALIAQMKMIWNDGIEAVPGMSFESYVDTLIFVGYEVVKPATNDRRIYTDPIPVTLQWWEAPAQNAVLLP